MNRKRLIHSVTGVVSAGLLLTALVPSAIAAVPLAHATVTATPSTVSPGDVAGYIVTFTNDDTSNIAKVGLTATMSDGYAYSIDSASTSLGKCNTGAGPLTCTIGSVKPGVTVTVVVGLTTNPAGTGVDTLFRWNSSGTTGSDGGTSHGDYWTVTGTTSLSADTNFRGRFVAKSTQLTVANDQAISSANPHATKVVSPVTLIPVTVQDGPTTSIDCGPAFALCPATAFGETSVINVDNGRVFGTAFQVVISFDASEIPSGVNQNNIKIYHQWSDGSGTGDELIAASCTTAKGSSVPTNVPCITPKKLAGNDLQVTVWTFHNGSMKGYN